MIGNWFPNLDLYKLIPSSLCFLTLNKRLTPNFWVHSALFYTLNCFALRLISHSVGGPLPRYAIILIYGLLWWYTGGWELQRVSSVSFTACLWARHHSFINWPMNIYDFTWGERERKKYTVSYFSLSFRQNIVLHGWLKKCLLTQCWSSQNWHFFWHALTEEQRGVSPLQAVYNSAQLRDGDQVQL